LNNSIAEIIIGIVAARMAPIVFSFCKGASVTNSSVSGIFETDDKYLASLTSP
jgi:hypothetical protein